MFVSYDTHAGATYVEWENAPVAKTVSVTDLVMVDVDAHGAPVGIEFAVRPDRITPEMVELLIARFPVLKPMSDMNSWLLVGA